MEADDIGDINLPAAPLLPEHDSSQINISDVIAAIQTADPISTLGMFATNPAGGGGGGGGGEMVKDPPQHSPNPMPMHQQQQQHQQAVNAVVPSNQQQQQSSGNSIRRTAYVKITEQPAGKALRFRYECEGRSAGSIPGVNSTPENRTFPSIQVVGYKGRAVVVVSCVTKDPPYRPHPHNLVGREGCRRGVCTVEINSETMSVVFSNLGIQCVKKKDIEAALKVREEIRVDPFRTGFSHRCQATGIDLNAVRLCFQVFLESEQRGRFTVPLPPVVSDPIYDKKAMSELVICKLSDCSCSVAGGKEVILLCEKVARDDISVRFFEEQDGKIRWQAYGDFQHTNVHKQVAISFRTPKYERLDVREPVKVYIQLQRPSDGATSEALPFDYLPIDSGRRQFWSLRKSFRDKPDMEMFQRILAEDKAVLNNLDKESVLTKKTDEVIVLDTPSDEVKPLTQEADLICENEIDNIIKERAKEFEVDEKENHDHNNVQKIPDDKTTEWIKSSEFERIDLGNGGVYDSPNSVISPSDGIVPVSSYTDNTDQDQMLSDDDKTLNDLLEQVAELDEIYTDHHIRRDILQDNTVSNELNNLDNCLPKSTAVEQMDFDDFFDDAATYTSLQRAFKNPVPMVDLMPPTPPPSQPSPEHPENQNYDFSQVIVNPQAPMIDVSSLKRDSVSQEEEKLPPLPPKRIRKQENENRLILNENMANRSDSTKSLSSRPQSQFIIMKTPDQSPPTKKLPPTPNQTNSNTLPKQKKPGFFSKLFSRRKSKSDLSSEPDLTSSKKTTPSESREPSVVSIPLQDPKRASVKSSKSLQPSDAATARGKFKKSKPLGRSVSSASGKRPHLTPDVIHIPLKGDSSNSLPMNEAYSNASTATIGNNLDRKTVSALQLADLPLQDGNMELIAIADAQSLKNLCEGKYGIELDPNVDLTEAEHYALYTSVPPQATASEFDETSCYYAQVDAGEILTPAQVAERLNTMKN